MDHEAHVGFVDAHAEGDRRADHAHFIPQKRFLILRARLPRWPVATPPPSFCENPPPLSSCAIISIGLESKNPWRSNVLSSLLLAENLVAFS